MIDIEGCSLGNGDREILRHPLVGGVILFARNYTDTKQLAELTSQLHEMKTPRLLIAVDHEGGRVQRFRSEFTNLPAAADIGKIFDEDAATALSLARQSGWVMGRELGLLGIDFSFAPVLDLFDRRSKVINDRAYHRDPNCVSRIAGAMIEGLHDAGMGAVGKHFPGHGCVVADSHLELPVDDRSYYDISNNDLIPFRRLAEKLQGIMPAHVLYPHVDHVPAGYSKVWIQQILRQELNFTGVVFSDDLSMVGAAQAGGIIERADAASSAGCDMLLVCNDRPAVEVLLSRWQREIEPVAQARLIRLHGKPAAGRFADLDRDKQWLAAREAMHKLAIIPELDLGDDAPA